MLHLQVFDRPARVLSVFLVLALLPGIAPLEAGGDPTQDGQWDAPFTWPTVAIHAAMLPTGQVLTYLAEEAVEGSWLWDPATGWFEEVDTPTALFCSGHSFLPDGKLIATGGTRRPDRKRGIRTTTIFDPWLKTWTQVEPMHVGRWYPTNTTLGDGRTLVFAGNNQFGQLTGIVEVYESGIGWTTIPSAERVLDWYPRMFLLPNGDIFHSGPEATTQMLDTDAWGWYPVADTNYGVRENGTGVLLPGLDRVLTLGGSDYGMDNPATETAEIIDLGTPNETVWRYTATPMHYPRKNVNTVILPDGNVLIVGGTRLGDDERPIFAAEIFDPDTETFRTVARMQEPRMYHSVALLLPDGRVLAAGSGNCPGCTDYLTAEIYSPPYLFWGDRPSILGAPAEISYGVPFTVDTDEAADIGSVVLIRPAAVTHSFNQEQRLVDLAFTAEANSLIVTPTSNPNEAPPGYYMLFILNSDGIPSVAAWVKLS